MADIQLFYFDVRALAEVSRLVLALAGKEYEDVRWTRAEWETVPKYKEDAPFGQGPYLIYNGKKIGQSAAIACFLAREFGLFGQSNEDAAVIDQVIHIYKDLYAAFLKEVFETDETKKAEMLEKLKKEDFPKYFGHFAKLFNESDTGFYVGNGITLADLYVFDIMLQLKLVREYDAGDLYPELKALCERVGQNERIKNYVKNRKETSF